METHPTPTDHSIPTPLKPARIGHLSGFGCRAAPFRKHPPTWRRPVIGIGVLVAFLPLLSGCSSNTEDDIVDTGSTDTAPMDGGDAPASLPSLDALSDGWNELFPGGDTICARGGPFSFFVHPGKVDKVVVDFMGGGACWSAVSCAENTDTFYFYDTVDPVREAVMEGTLSGVGKLDGIYNRSRDDNPFKDWHHVVIPYCTGDLHWGDNSQDYGDIRIEHRGAVNARSVLQWIYDNFTAPEQIFVTGCSAGSYGSILWSAYVMEHYPNTDVIQFGDSGAGVTTPDFFDNGFLSWNGEAAYPDWIPALDPETHNILFPDIYIGIADHYPDNFLSQFNYTFDGAQYFYFSEMGGGDKETFTADMMDSFEKIESSASNFAVFVPAGTGHCILLFEAFYTLNADGTLFADWLRELITTGAVNSVIETAGE